MSHTQPLASAGNTLLQFSSKYKRPDTEFSQLLLLTTKVATFGGFPFHSPRAAFLAPACPTVSFGAEGRQSALFSKYVITFLKASLKWTQLFMPCTCCYFSWSTKRVLGWKCDLLRLGSVMVIAELCCSYEFYFNFSVNSSPFSFVLLIRHKSIRGNITLQLEKQFHFQKLEHLG